MDKDVDMESGIISGAVFQQNSLNPHINATDLLHRFHHYANQVTYLSLDCFDTILWRDAVMPKDVFFNMQNRPYFKKCGITAANRIDAESYARSLMYTQYGHSEVTLHDIYRTAFLNLGEEDIAALIEEEILSELEACRAFEPIVNMMRAAMQNGKKIIIVSNTYLLEPQLRRLLAHALPPDVYTAINTVFCSCEYKQSKNGMLFDEVILKLNIPAKTILHIGDNQDADLTAACMRGINALHLVQFNAKQAEFLRLQTTAATMTDANIHYTRPMLSPYRRMFAAAHHVTDNPASLIGYMSVGPIMYAFGRYICEEVEQLKQAGKKPKVLFMMRDAYLPSLVCEILTGNAIGSPVRISRFSAVAASFRSKEDIVRYLAGGVELGYLHLSCRQLLIPAEKSKQLVQQAEASADPVYMLSQILSTPENIAYIIDRSTKYWQRLKKYLLKIENIQPGDTVVMVDLGYVGRTQRCLAPIFKQDLGVEVIGRYMLSLNVLEWQLSRKGLIDPSWCDDRLMDMLCTGNTLFEEFCCSADNSVDDYDDTGEPIFAPSSAKTNQRDKTKLIQDHALQFVKDAKQFFTNEKNESLSLMLRDITVSELARRAFLPIMEEINYLQDFEHDENRGTDLCFFAFNAPEKELKSLRKHGLWFKNQNAYGLRSAGFELALTSMASHRYAFEVSLYDMTHRSENILVITTANNNLEKRLIPATPTHDGYYTLWFDLPSANTQVAVMFGLSYQLIQIDNIEIINRKHFYTKHEFANKKDITNEVHLIEMNKSHQNLFECASPSSSLIAQVNSQDANNGGIIMRIIYRPIVKRQ